MGELWDIIFGVKIEKKFDLEHILPCSVADYLDSRGKSPDNYRMVGVHYSGKDNEGFQKAVPEGTEAVVEYRSSITTIPSFLFVDVCFDRYGVALIPK